MLVAKPLEALERKSVIGALRLLQAQDVGLGASQEARHQLAPQPDRVDVPGGDLEGHGVQFMTRGGGIPTSRLVLPQPSTS